MLFRGRKGDCDAISHRALYIAKNSVQHIIPKIPEQITQISAVAHIRQQYDRLR
jgi:hypothetical protein